MSGFILRNVETLPVIGRLFERGHHQKSAFSRSWKHEFYRGRRSTSATGTAYPAAATRQGGSGVYRMGKVNTYPNFTIDTNAQVNKMELSRV